MDALGTHLVENAMRKRNAAHYGFKLHVQGRINDGGCKLPNPLDDKLISKHPDWRVENFIQYFYGSCKDDLREVCEDSLVQMIEQIKKVVGELDLHEYSVNEAANSAIMARIISFNDKKQSKHNE